MSNSAPKQALPTGYEMNGYRLIDVLGIGGFGITYRAEHIALGHKVAIKEYLPNEFALREGTTVYPKSEADREDFNWGLTRFLDEAKTLAKFKHRNLVRVRDYFEANSTAYIVMDYEEGESLDRLLAEHGTLTESQLRRVLLPIVEGLREVHKAGFLHRDIKPSNIFIRRSDESPVLLDFGAARQALGRKSKSLTAVASAGYSPPEQYESEGEQGPWTDIYALSALCYRAITGQAPVEAPRRLSMLARGRPDPLSSLDTFVREAYSQQLREAIDSGLRTIETERPASLDKWLALLSVASTRVRQPSAVTDRLPSNEWKDTGEAEQTGAFVTGFQVGTRVHNAVQRFGQFRANQQPRLAVIWLIGAVAIAALAAFLAGPYWLGLLAGAAGATFVVSLVLGAIFFRSVDPPKKQLLATLFAIPVCGTIYGIGAADGGDPKFVEGFGVYCLAGLIVMSLQSLRQIAGKRKSSNVGTSASLSRIEKWLIGTLALVAALVVSNFAYNQWIEGTGNSNEPLISESAARQGAIQRSAPEPDRTPSETRPLSTGTTAAEATSNAVLVPTSQPLTIEVAPSDARVRILNIRPKYEPEMLLPAGEYQVEVSSPGYSTAVEMVRHESAEPTVHRVELQLPRLPASGNVVGRLESGDFRLDSGAFADLWIMQIETGQFLTAELSSDDIDPVMYLLDSQGDLIAHNDDSGDVTDARISLRLEIGGEFVLLASSFSEEEVGDYELNVGFSSNADVGGSTGQPANASQTTAFTRGSHEDDVLRVQGTPTAIRRYPALGHEVWSYGLSIVEISTATRRVTEWSNHAGNLKVQLTPGLNTTSSSTFTRGSHEDDVLRIQGTPTAIRRYPALGHEVWSYGLSSVEISTATRRVTEWSNHAGNLKVRLNAGGGN